MTLASLPGEPCSGDGLTAGDTWTWGYDTARSRVPGAVLSYVLAGPGNPLVWDPTFIASLVGTFNTVKIPADITAQLDGGTYTFARLLTDGADRYTDRLPALQIQANPATLAAGAGQPWQEVAIAAIEGVLTGNATSGMQMYMVDGRQVVNWPLKDLTRILDRLRRELARIRRNYRPRQRLITFNPIAPWQVPYHDVGDIPWRQ